MSGSSEAVYRDRTYGARTLGYGDSPGIIVVDFQTAFTDPQYPLGGAPLIQRAVENTARLLDVARSYGVPVASCYTAYNSRKDMPYWKISAILEDLIEGHPSTQLDRRVYDPDYDVAMRKSGASIFFQTPAAAYFNKEKVDTVIVTGCVTSGCVRASIIDSFQWGFRTIVPEDCVGDHDEEPHRQNLRDVERRYCDVTNADDTIAWLEQWRGRNHG